MTVADRPRRIPPAHLASLPDVRDLAEPIRTRVVGQEGVATAAQLLDGGMTVGRVRQRVDDGRVQRLFRGVVVLHSGPVTWRQRAQAGLLAAGPGAALSHGTAAHLHGFVRAAPTEVAVSVPLPRSVRPQRGLVVHRRRTMPFAGGRPRIVEAHATVVDLVHVMRTPDEVVGVLCDAVRAGLLADRIVRESEHRGRLRHRDLVRDVLGSGDGIESPLEHRYLRAVERAHGLPPSRGQVRERVGGRWIRADRVHPGLGVRVELDGQLAHPFGRTDDDVWRDNAVLVERSDVTLRYRWRHVAVEPCSTARQVAAALQARGWHGTLRPCGSVCPVIDPALDRRSAGRR